MSKSYFIAYYEDVPGSEIVAMGSSAEEVMKDGVAALLEWAGGTEAEAESALAFAPATKELWDALFLEPEARWHLRGGLACLGDEKKA